MGIFLYFTGMGQFLNALLCETLKEYDWSLIPDETTDGTGDSKMAITVQYFDPRDFKMKVDVLALANPKDVSANGSFFYNSPERGLQTLFMDRSSFHDQSGT